MNFSAGSGSVAIVASTAAPAAVTVLNTAHMRSSSKVRAQSTAAPYTALAYITVTASTAVSLSSVPTITVSSPSGASGAYYYEGYWVTLPQSGTFMLTQGTSAYFAIYTGGTLPSPNPNGCVGVQPDTSTVGGARTAAVGVQPTSGAYDYTGNLTETTFRSSPCPIPTGTSTAVVTITVTMSPGPASNVYENSTESDAYSTETVSTNTSALVEATPVTGGTGFSELNETTTDEVGDSTVTIYATPLLYAIASPLPYGGTITNGPPSTVDATLADGSTSQRTYNSDGSYTECDTIAGLSGTCSSSSSGSGSVDTITVSSNDSGSYLIQSPNFVSYGITSIVFSYAAPSGGQDTITQTTYDNTTPSATQYTVPQWWTGSTLYSDTTTSASVTSLPTQCTGSALTSLGGIDEFARTISTLDPVLGYTDTRTIDSYVSEGYQSSSTPVGPVCVVITDTESLYYDYFLDTTYLFYPSFNGEPLQVDTINESYWFSSTSPPTGYSTVRTSSSPGGIPGLAASIAAHEAGITFTRTLQRAQRMENFVRSIASHLGGLK